MNTHGISRTGPVRTENQDRYLIRELDSRSCLLAVADGMGGQAGGGLAAEVVIERLARWRPEPAAGEQELLRLVREANEAVRKAAARERALRNMGTTLLALLLNGEEAAWVHVGDCRLYLRRRGELRQITLDQNMAQYLVEQGDLDPEQARLSPTRHLLDQYVGFPYCEPVSGRLAVEPGDLLLLCTDGLHDELSYTAMAGILGREGSLAGHLRRLVAAAEAAGGQDNVTAVGVEVP